MPSCLEVIVEPAKQDLVRRQPQEILELLVLVQQPVKFRVELDVNTAQETFADDLPDQSEDEMLPPVGNILWTNVDDTASNTLGGGDDDVVVFRYLECVQSFGLWEVKNTGINGIWD